MNYWFQVTPRRWRRLITPLVCAAALACNDGATLIGSAPVDESIVTDGVAARRRRDGRFARAVQPKQAFDQIGYRDAERLADAYLRTFGVLAQSRWSRDAGRPVDARRLVRCGPTLFARSAYDLSNTDLSIPLRNFVAGAFVTHFCEGTTPVLFFSVSEAASGLRVLRDGRLQFPTNVNASHLLYSQVIPREVGGDFAVVSPERAAEIVAQRTNRRVSTVPVLVRAPFPHTAMFARYVIDVDEPLETTGSRSQSRQSSARFFVGLEIGVFSSATPLLPIGSATFSKVDSLPIPFSAGRVAVPRWSYAPNAVEPWTPSVRTGQ